MPTHVLIAGVSTRAVAESAARVGFAVTAIDAFADADQHASVRAQSVPGALRFRASQLADHASAVRCDAVVYGSGFENDPRSVKTLAIGRALWGNSPKILQRVRQPALVRDALMRSGQSTPSIRIVAEDVAPNDLQRDWLVKPFRSGGGYRVRAWRNRQRVPSGCYLQERIEGIPGSVVFVAADGNTVPLGISRQLTGDRAFGARDFRYCGSILVPAGDGSLPHDDAIAEKASDVARVIAREFGLVGVNGVDFVARETTPYPIEVNPRWCASMDLVEMAYGISMFGAHAAACADHSLPNFDLRRCRSTVSSALGKAIIFARQDVMIGDTTEWLADPEIRDVPHPGERIAAGSPICTVYARSADVTSCYSALVRRAERLYARLRDASARDSYHD